uniref:BAH domain-containing protein n=1 Tax=Anopheles farauti TaxID=69004 RepID=A0A182QNL3_9DIPT
MEETSCEKVHTPSRGQEPRRNSTMKPKKQQSSSASDRKPSAGGTSSGAVPSSSASLGTAGTEAKSTSTNASSSIAPASAPPTKKPVKRLQSKAKETASSSQTGGPTTTATVAPPAAGKSSEKPSPSTAVATISGAGASSSAAQSNKSKSGAASGAKTTAAMAASMASTPNAPKSTASSVESVKEGCGGGVAADSGANVSSTSAPIGSAAGYLEPSVAATPPSKGNKGAAKTIKSDSIGSTAQTQGSTAKGTPKDARKSSKGGGGSAATKKAASQAEKSDSGKRKQSTAGTANPSSASVGTGGSGENRPQGAGAICTPTAFDSKLREKEKKIQKELKNLGVPDKTINQSIDAAYLLESVESVVNPSISEMVKTKSRATVAQGKYGGGGGDSIITAGGGQAGRKSSTTSEDPPPSADAEVEKHPKESIATATTGTGKAKKSVTLKLDHQPEEGSKQTKSSGKGASAKEPSTDKAGPKSARKDEKGAGASAVPGAATSTASSKSSSKATGQGAKTSKKANNPTGPTESKQKKVELTAKNVAEQQKKDIAAIEAPQPVVKQSSEPDCSSLAIGRSSSDEQEDHEEQKNEEVHSRIDSIVKALEREDIETTPTGTKKDVVDTTIQAGGKEEGSAVGAPAVHTPQRKGSTEGKAKKQATPRKPPAKKEATAASKSKAKEASDKKKASAPDAPDKKEVKFQEQTPASPAKRKYVKKPKTTAAVEESISGEKPAKIAKSSTAKKAPAAAAAAAATSKAKQAEVAKGGGKVSTVSSSTNQDIGTKGVDSTKDDKTPAAPVKPSEPAASVVSAGRDRSSTENDDDLPLRQLQQKQNQAQPARESGAQSTEKSAAADPTSSQVLVLNQQEKLLAHQSVEKEKEDHTDSCSGGVNASNASGPILAGLLKSSAKQPKRPYVRKTTTAAVGGGGGENKNSKTAATASVSNPVHSDETKERKLEKKDVYDFDDSESEIETPVKPGKPSFKRKSSVDISQSREDISRDAADDPDPVKAKAIEDDGKRGEPASVAEGCGEGDETAKEKRTTVPLKKQKRRIEAILSESLKAEQRSGASSASEKEQDEDGAGVASVVAPEAKVKKKATALASRKLKQETKHDSHSSADEADDDDDGEDDDHDDDGDEDGADDDNGSGDSDGCSSTDTVRTRIAKKRQSAKKRNVKLYGFWSGPKRHRVASLNALAKVHCLYENEMRGALEASLMSQSSGSRVIRTITKDGERIKKERICPEEESGGEESRSGETPGAGESTEQPRCKEVEQSKAKESEKKKAGDEKKDSVKQERKEAASQQQPPQQQQHQQQKQAPDGTAREELKAKVKEEAPKKDSDQDSAESSEEEPVVARNLRCVPGLRGAGKHWDPDASSLESEIEQLPDSDETYAQGKDTDPTRKRKIKKKVVRKSKAKTAAVQAKVEKSEKEKEGKSEKATEKPEKPPKPPVKKIKKELKALLTDNERQDDGAASSSSTASEKGTAAKTKPSDDGAAAKKRKRQEPKSEPGGDYKDYIGKKRMASLNATAMLAATYEVQRVLYRNTDSSDSECSAEKAAPKSKKASKESKDQKERAEKEAAAKVDGKKDTAGEKDSARGGEAMQPGCQPGAAGSPVDSKQLDMGSAGTSQPSTSGGISVAQQEVLTKKKKVVIKTEPMRDRKDDPMEVKREIEEPRPVSSNLVIAQDTEVTITGVYVNSSLGTNQEAYCKMQYRVQQSVTEERLVRPGEAPPKSYTPLSALSSMRPPNDQALSTPPLFVPPAQCDSPLGPPRAFYPPPTSSSGSSSAFCAPMPHDSPGKCVRFICRCGVLCRLATTQ